MSQASASDGDGVPIRRLTPKAVRRGVEILCERDAGLAGIVERQGVPPVRLRKAGFATLAQIIVEQQVTLASGRAIWARLEGGLDTVTPETVFARTVDDLRSMGLSIQKATYIHGIAAAALDGELNFRRVHRADDEGAREQLIRMKGVGRWTADIYLLTAMGRPDVWPRGDLALDTALMWLKRLRKKPRPERIDKLTGPWSPWRSVAARILWLGYVHEVKGG
ncbi:MAG: DNA-3-methyladenine glycosylase 2 family protein [Acidimicrobiia bacterium]|nr:DNA-3-methyladenine glycosylase 2 family protein [Acidimicrobiia bacterium]